MTIVHACPCGRVSSLDLMPEDQYDTIEGSRDWIGWLRAFFLGYWKAGAAVPLPLLASDFPPSSIRSH